MSDWGKYEFLSEIIVAAQAATVKLGSSTAIMISDRYALTAAHSPLDANNQITPDITVYNLWGEVRNIINVNYLVTEDLAVVELESPFENSYSVRVSDSSAEIEEVIFTVGHPGVLAKSGLGWAVSFGSPTDLHRSDKPWYSWFSLPALPGNSGGGIFNETGELVGIVSGNSDWGLVSPWSKEEFSVDNGKSSSDNGRLTSSPNIDLINTFISRNEIQSISSVASEKDLPENKKDPVGIELVSADAIQAIELSASEGRKSSVLVSDLEAVGASARKYVAGGSGTILKNNFILTAMHALDDRSDLSVGFYSEEEAKASVFDISLHGDWGLAKLNDSNIVSYPALELAALPVQEGDVVYAIGSPRKYWWTEGGWQVFAGTAIDTNQHSISHYDLGGLSGGGVFNLDSDLVGVVAIGSPQPRIGRYDVLDRQDPHNTDWAPIFLNPDSAGTNHSEGFYYLKKFVSSNTPSSIDELSVDFFTVSSKESGDFIYEWGWKTVDQKNTGFVARYFRDGTLDESFSERGFYYTEIGSVDDQIKDVFIQPNKIILFGSTSINGPKNIFQANLLLNGSPDEKFGNAGYRIYRSDYDETLVGVKKFDSTYYLIGNRFGGKTLDAFILSLDDDEKNFAFGRGGYALIQRDQSADLSADLSVTEAGIHILFNSDISGEWASEVSKFDYQGNIDLSFGEKGSSEIFSGRNFGVKIASDGNGSFIVSGHDITGSSIFLEKLDNTGKSDQSFQRNFMETAYDSGVTATDPDSGIIYNGGVSYVMDILIKGEIEILLWDESTIRDGGLKTRVLAPRIIKVSEKGEVLEKTDFASNNDYFPIGFVHGSSSDNFFVAHANDKGYRSGLISDMQHSKTINDIFKNQVTVSNIHRTSILVDKDVLGASPAMLEGLTENIEKSDGVTTSHVFSFNGSDYDYDDISPFIMIVVRDNEFTDVFRSELADFAPEYKDLSYQEAVDAVGLIGISAAIITVAGADGNYIG